jgi:Mlc titration factor MtfA (ptsG expression regulator)
MLSKWRQWRAERFDARHPFPQEEWLRACERLPLLAALDHDERQRLGQRTWRLLHRKRLTLSEGLDFDLPDRLSLLAQAGLLTLGWSEADAEGAFAGVHEIIVLPEAFRRQVEEMDEAGVMHEYMDERVGETWHQGPVVLSLADVRDSGDWTGFNVIIHELAHKLDMENSLDADGFPSLSPDIDSREWYQTFMAVWNDLQAHLERGEPTPIDDYAATHPGECFAVCCEHFFTAPDVLNEAYPALYALLRRYFRQNPLARFKACQTA